MISDTFIDIDIRSDDTTTYGTPAADAVAAALCHDDLITIRLALRQAAQRDLVGNRFAFNELYRRLGGTAPECGM